MAEPIQRPLSPELENSALSSSPSSTIPNENPKISASERISPNHISLKSKTTEPNTLSPDGDLPMPVLNCDELSPIICSYDQESKVESRSPHEGKSSMENCIESLSTANTSPISNQSSRRRSSRLTNTKSGGTSGKTVISGESGGSLENSPAQKKRKTIQCSKNGNVCFCIGEPVPDQEARTRWPWRYQDSKRSQDEGNTLRYNSNGDDEEEDVTIKNVKCHYFQAKIAGCVFSLGDCAYVKGPEGAPNYIGKILEFFESMDGEQYFRVQWFFRAADTVIEGEAKCHDGKRLFYSTLVNDNLLDCIVSKVKVLHISSSLYMKSKSVQPYNYYYDMKYSVDYSSFSAIGSDESDSSLSPSSMGMHKNVSHKSGRIDKSKAESVNKHGRSELALLDLFSGCGGMSTGLCLGAKASGVSLVTKWAVDIDKSSCESLRLNHPETKIRNESAEDFHDLLKEWDRLCKRYGGRVETSHVTRAVNEKTGSETEHKSAKGEYEVASLVDICYSDPTGAGKRGLKFQVRWVGYGPSEDTWEPVEGLSKCQDRIREFVLKGIKAKILPRPGDVDVICGGPPCQGISGYNRFRNVASPLDDEKNRQIAIFMDIVNFLRPKYILMENVIDILRMANGCLGRYAMGRLVHMNYQARLGIMAAGCYGLAQFRLRVFLWGAHLEESLPQFPLPTHDVIIKYGFPSDFERNVVAYDEGQPRNLEKALDLSDAISDLPPVSNDEISEKKSYTKPPETEFQKFIRAAKCDMMGCALDGKTQRKSPLLLDHRPHPLGEDDYLRVCAIPKKKGANFRDLPGVCIGAGNVVRRTEEHVLMPSGKHWVPDYALSFRGGTSRGPFGRLWWDETVPTVFCEPDFHSRAMLHPEQDRVLTVRECARLQGFQDYYEFFGKVKERYRQVGNAVAVPVGRALGYALGMAAQKLSDDKPIMTLPHKFSYSTTVQLLSLLSDSEVAAS